MKKSLALAMIGSLAAISHLSAQVNIYVAGSTAFRANAVRAITNLYGANITSQNDGNAAHTYPTDVTGASVVTFTGTIPSLFASQTVNVKCYWSGSAQGIHSLCNGDILPFLSSGTSGSSTLDSHAVDFTFSDCSQASTPFNNYTLVDNTVAVLPFVWVRNYGTSTNLMNLSMQQLQNALAAGKVALSYFTGSTNASDTNTLVYLTGRNTDSGTRVTTDADTYFTGSPKIWEMNLSTGVPFLASTNQTVGGYGYGVGYTSGGQVKSALEATTTNMMLGYLGYPDARGAFGTAFGNSAIISCNGQLPYTNGLVMANNNGSYAIINTTNLPDFSPVTTGKYSYWCYEHALYGGVNNAATANPNALALYNYMVTNGVDSDLSKLEANGGPVTCVRLSEMKVLRSADGGAISTK